MNLLKTKTKEKKIRGLRNPLFLTGGKIQHPYIQVGAQFECFFHHVFPATPANADEAFLTLHHQIYLVSPGTLLILWYYNR